VIMNQFKEVDIDGKVNINSKLHEIAYLDNTSLCPPVERVKTKGAKKRCVIKFARSTRRIFSYFKHVNALH